MLLQLCTRHLRHFPHPFLLLVRQYQAPRSAAQLRAVAAAVVSAAVSEAISEAISVAAAILHVLLERQFQLLCAFGSRLHAHDHNHQTQRHHSRDRLEVLRVEPDARHLVVAAVTGVEEPDAEPDVVRVVEETGAEPDARHSVVGAAVTGVENPDVRHLAVVAGVRRRSVEALAKLSRAIVPTY